MTDSTMPYRRLGRAGIKVSVFSFGSWVSFDGMAFSDAASGRRFDRASHAPRLILFRRPSGAGVALVRVAAQAGPADRVEVPADARVERPRRRRLLFLGGSMAREDSPNAFVVPANEEASERRYLEERMWMRENKA